MEEGGGLDQIEKCWSTFVIVYINKLHVFLYADGSRTYQKCIKSLKSMDFEKSAFKLSKVWEGDLKPVFWKITN